MDQGRTGRRQHHVGREILIADCNRPSRTRVVATRSFGQAGSRNAEKSISAASTWRSGSRSNGSNRAEDNPRPKVTEVPAGENPPISISERNDASSVIRRQNPRSRARAPSRPPSTKPDARSTPLTAPALAPLIASTSQSGSSSSRSRTPQVNAPNEPPPCKAKDSRRGGQVRLSAKRRFCQAPFCQMVLSFGVSARSGPGAVQGLVARQACWEEPAPRRSSTRSRRPMAALRRPSEWMVAAYCAALQTSDYLAPQAVRPHSFFCNHITQMAVRRMTRLESVCQCAARL